MRIVTAASAIVALLFVAGCDSTAMQDGKAAVGEQGSIVGGQILGDPQDLRDYALGQTEQAVTQHLHRRPVSRKTDPSGGETVTWLLRDSRTIVGLFDNQGGLIEVHFGHDDTAKAKPKAK